MKNNLVMIADDDPDIVEVVTLMLEDAGYEVKATLDGNKAKNISDPLPAVILLDIWMSGIDGRDICCHLKAQTSTKNIPVIMVSANKDTKEIALDCGADDFIAKPFEMNELLKKVGKYISTSDV